MTPSSRLPLEAWVYPGQADGRGMGGWFLLMIISMVLASIVHRAEEENLLGQR